MSDEPFRTLVRDGFLLLIPIMLFFRIRAHASREPLDRRQEGWFILATLRPTALVAVVAFVAYIRNPASMAWSSLPLPAALRWAGVGVVAVGLGCLVWTLVSLGRNLTDTVVTRRASTLVTHGPYRYVRHPFYGSVTLVLLANSVVAANWFIAVCCIAVIALLVVRTDREEHLLVARFGNAYQEYMARTGRFFPRW